MSVFVPQNPDQNSDSVFKSSLKEIRIRVEESSVSILSDRSPPQTVLNATHLIEPAFLRTPHSSEPAFLQTPIPYFAIQLRIPKFVNQYNTNNVLF